MRILHTSDWHLGQNFYGKSRAVEHQQFLTWLLSQVQEQKIACVIVAGDIFDTGTPPSYAREMYFDFIVNMHKLNCQLVILAGNHDSVAMLGESKQLLKSLSARVIPNALAHSVDCTDNDNIDDSETINEQVFYLNDQLGKPQAVICAIPFIRPRDILKSQAGQSANDKNQSLQQAIKDHYQHLYQYAQKLSRAKDDKILPIIATGHLTTVGVTISESVRDIYIGTLEAFPASAFPSADYIALGHIHRAQKVAKTEHIRYCGSPIPLSFDEAEQAKKVLVVDFNQNKLDKVTEIEVPVFQPMMMVKSTLNNLANQATEQVNMFTELNQGQKIWLDIEIESSDYLLDLHSRIEQLISDLPVEILLVRRSKKSRQAMPNNQKKITLNELSLMDVFNTRIDQEDWRTEEDLSLKSRLTTLFQQAVSEVESLNQSSKEEQVKAGGEQ
ncbi:MAG: exonuclease subunit SbcD [Colwellia sp.]|nr:exonuclease subunit SbcD [Colwellia sp.]